ncbi:hypothetical protein D3C78_1056270 [compost metagenome]
MVEKVGFACREAGTGQHFLQVGAGAEGRASAGENQHAQFVIGGDFVQAQLEFSEDRQVQRVHRPGAIEGQARDGPDGFEQQYILVHDDSHLPVVAQQTLR